MARNNALNFNLPSVDDLFSTEESRAEARLVRPSTRVSSTPSTLRDGLICRLTLPMVRMSWVMP